MPSAGRAHIVKDRALHIYHIPASRPVFQPRDAAGDDRVHQAVVLELFQHKEAFSRRDLRRFQDDLFIKAKEQLFACGIKSAAEDLFK